MEIDIVTRPASSAARIKLNAQETLTAQVGAMIAVSTEVKVETTSRKKGGKGGLMKGLKRMFSFKMRLIKPGKISGFI